MINNLHRKNWKEDWRLGILLVGFGTIALIINFTVLLILSSFTPAPPKEVQQIVDDIIIPSRSNNAQKH